MPSDLPIAKESGWRVVRLGSIAVKIGSGATPAGGESAYLRRRERFALVRSQNVFDRRFDAASLAFISDAQATKLRGVALQRGDLLLNITGDGVTFARACTVPHEILPACVNQHVAIIRVDPTKADPGYVLGYLTHPAVKSYIESFNSGGSRRAVTKGHIESFRLPLPPLSMQRSIAAILGALDDKIALNARMNATLEAMARAVFEDWFVRFGPVRAKAEGHAPPGLAPDLAALFPDRLSETQEGEVPEGWAFASLGSAANHIRDTLNPGDFPGEIFAHFSLPAFDNGAEPERMPGSDIRSQKFAVTRNAVLLSKLNPVTPRVWLADYRETERAVASTEFLVLAAREGWSREWLYCQSVQPGFRIELQSLVTGTSNSHQRAQPQAIMALRVVRPTPSILSAFQAVVAPMLDRVLANRREAHTLTALRDLLLPRLISGQLRLRDAERAVEAAL